MAIEASSSWKSDAIIHPLESTSAIPATNLDTHCISQALVGEGVVTQ